MNNYRDPQAVCPFYIRSNANRIVCEGVSDENKIHLIFADQKKTVAYFNTYCGCLSNCNNCIISDMLNRKYEGGDQSVLQSE